MASGNGILEQVQHMGRSNAHCPTTIAIAGGKGGIGKSAIAVNLSAALAGSHRRVLLIDGDFALANADLLLGLTPKYTLRDVLDGARSLDEAISVCNFGFSVLAGASGISRLATLGESEILGLVRAFSSLKSVPDTVVIDTAAGLSPAVTRLSHAAQEILVVICDEPASLADAYAYIKVMRRNHGVRRFHIIANMARGDGEGGRVFAMLKRVTDRFLDVSLRYTCEIPDDPYMRRAIRNQQPVVIAHPGSPSARALKYLAKLASAWSPPAETRGTIEFFAERLIARPTARLELVG
ncbi:MAG: P-loop NTPase [Steroidobacteraceae bacterium]